MTRDLLTMSHEDPARLLNFARRYVETGCATTAIQKAGVQNPQYRLAVWRERLLAMPHVQTMIEEHKHNLQRWQQELGVPE